MPKNTPLSPDPKAKEAREALAKAKEPKSIPALWDLVRQLAQAMGIRME